MRLFLAIILFLAFAGRLGAQCPGNGYASSAELIKNGDFLQGNNDFSSSYTHCNTGGCIGWSQGKYTVDKNASDYSMFFSGKDHTTGKGEFWIGTTDGVSNSTAWCQTVRVKPRTNYVISAWFSNLNINVFFGSANLQFAVNGTPIGSSFTAPKDTGTWEQQELMWYSGNNSSINLCIINKSPNAFYGIGFGIDDISMRECLCNYPATASKDTTICEGESVKLKASLGNSYIWTPTAGTSCSNCQEATVKPTGTTNYFVAVTDTSTCLSTAVVKVTVNQIPKAKIKGDTLICNGAPAVLKATLPDAAYLWSTGSKDSFISVTKPGTYKVKVTVKGCSATDSFIVKETDVRFNLGKDTALCDGQVLTLNIATQADSITWHNGSNNKSFNVTAAGKYWAKLKTNNCSFTDTITVQYKPNPVVNLGNDITLCEGQKIELDAGNTDALVVWSTGNTTQTITVSTAGTYWAKVTRNGCSTNDTINIKYQKPITVSLGADSSLCEGGIVELKAKNTAWQNPVYLWQDGSAAENFFVTKPGKYCVFVKEGACTASDTIEINYKPKPVLNIGKDITVCADEEVMLDAGISADSYLWSTGETTKAIKATSSGTYHISATINGCVASDTIKVTFLPLPIFSLGNDTTLCEGQTMLLHANVENVKYLWHDGFLSPYATVTKPGTYWAKADNGRCSFTDTIHVKYNSYPEVELGEDTLLCPGQTLLLDVTVDGASYYWNDSSTAGIKEITSPGKYWVVIANGHCTSSDTIRVFYKNEPVINLGKDTTLCGKGSWQLDAGNPDADFIWNTGQKTRTITVTKPGKYWVEASYCGIKAADTIALGFINYQPEDLYMPTAFSPNDDKLNDTLRAVGIDVIDDFEWRIYNRWGQLIFRTNDMKASWDGKLNGGVPAPEGLYHWKLTLRSPCLPGNDMMRTGNVYLIR